MSYEHLPLDQCIELHMKDWVKKFKEAAERQGDVESHIQLAKILIHGSKTITADPQQAVY